MSLPERLAKRRARGARFTAIRDEILFADGFLSRDECRFILKELEDAYWAPSLTYDQQPDGTYRNLLLPFRVSETAQQEFFSDGLRALLRRTERRLSSLFQFDASHLESWQATHYERKGKFDYHLDAGYWDGHYAGDRILAFLLYLDTPERGGSTHFRALDVRVEAKAGRLLVWDNLFPNGDCNHRMIHSATPVLRGEKTTLVTWQRQRPFRIPHRPIQKGD